MSLRDAHKPIREKTCRFTICAEVYKPEDIETLNEWIQNRMPTTQIVAALRIEYPNHSMAQDTLRAHMRGLCSCPNETLWKGVWA